jgi:hypothetical protein
MRPFHLTQGSPLCIDTRTRPCIGHSLPSLPLPVDCLTVFTVHVGKTSWSMLLHDLPRTSFCILCPKHVPLNEGDQFTTPIPQQIEVSQVIVNLLLARETLFRVYKSLVLQLSVRRLPLVLYSHHSHSFVRCLVDRQPCTPHSFQLLALLHSLQHSQRVSLSKDRESAISIPSTKACGRTRPFVTM